MGISALSGVLSFNTRKGAVTLTQAEVATLGFVDTDAGAQGVGTITFAAPSSQVASGATISGGSLLVIGLNSEGTGTIFIGTSCAGTWCNISPETINAYGGGVNTQGAGCFQRIS